MQIKPFIPSPLPPDIDCSSLIKEIGSAHRNLGQMNTLFETIPNPNLIITPLLTKEAVLSSKIEGTQATLENVFRFEAEGAKRQDKDIEIDSKEILNYRKAVIVAMRELKNKPFGENLIKKLHNILLDSVRGKNKDHGNFRKIQVFIGQPGANIDKATYIPPPANEIIPLISNWLKYIHSTEEIDPIIQTGIAHYQFEAIHPFLDGNGRIGRLLIPLILYQKNILTKPVFYISEFFEETRPDYYRLLNGVSKSGDWISWIKYFLTGVSIQANRTQTMILKMKSLYENLKQVAINMRSIYAVQLLDIIFDSPIITFVSIKDRMNTKSVQTIYNIIEKFQKADILKEISGRERDKVYAFNKLFDILESRK
jgi:Fic family protein